MNIAELILPVFGVILTGWLTGALNYLPRSLAASIMQFAYYVAMPALVFLTIAQAPVAALTNCGFLLAFGGTSLIWFTLIMFAAWRVGRRSLAASAMLAAAGSMTNTGFVALPVLQALFGARGVLPAAIATVFVALVLFPLLILALALDSPANGPRIGIATLARQVLCNPVMTSTIAGLLWSASGAGVPGPLAAYAGTLGAALTPCALFSVGLGLSLDGVRAEIRLSALLSGLKLLLMPLTAYALSLICGLTPFATVAAVVCAAVPTAKTAYVLASGYQVEETLVAATISLSTLLSVLTLVGWLYALT